MIDIIGYRRFGHNELDQPMFTQPLMYTNISRHPPVASIYEEQLLKEGVITSEEAKKVNDKIRDELEKSYANSKSFKFQPEDWSQDVWEEIKNPTKYGRVRDTGVDTKVLTDIGTKINTLPTETFKFHPMVKNIYNKRLKSIQEGKGIDWATAEALAWSSLITEGYHVRISGQDVERGTFSHRHAVLHNQENPDRYIPIAAFDQGWVGNRRFIASNSHLSEYAVLGFEYGYSLANPNTLCIWEAQFGDFANTAQVMIDTMIASGECKWNVHSGLVMLLPHGFDGQGPEHSSARLERYLQACDEDESVIPDYDTPQHPNVNWSVVNPTTSANYFHVLRRQLRRTFRKPMISMAPKKLLRLKDACSNIDDFGESLRFRRVYPETYPEEIDAPEKVKRVVFCSGQVYYDLLNARRNMKVKDVAIVRLEELHPFPYIRIEPVIKEYPNATVHWCQEEHRNAGAWNYVQNRFNNLCGKLNKPQISYHGRGPNAAASVGYFKVHEEQLNDLLKDTLKA